MKLFLDTANLSDIKQWAETGIIDGITTNPTHLSKEGGEPKPLLLAICDLMQGKDVSVEVVEEEPEAVYRQAKEIAQLADNVVVKVPCHIMYYPVIKKLVDDGVPLNITLVFSVSQSMMMCKLGVKYISPFIGRLDDIDQNGLELIAQLRAMVDEYNFPTNILAASIRGVHHLHGSILAGADVVTLPVKILAEAVDHPLTNKGMKKFLDDWQKLGIKQFP